jgi:hypothetical protein
VKILIYTGPEGKSTAWLTIDGIPALRMEGPGMDYDGLGPADEVPGLNIKASTLVKWCIIGKVPSEVGGTIHAMDEETQKAATKFLDAELKETPWERER